MTRMTRIAPTTLAGRVGEPGHREIDDDLVADRRTDQRAVDEPLADALAVADRVERDEVQRDAVERCAPSGARDSGRPSASLGA